jgi:DNA-binding protein HU-beta
MISMPEMISVLRKAHSSVFCEAVADKTLARKAMPGKPAETGATSEVSSAAAAKMPSAAAKMASAAAKMASATAKMASATAKMAAAAKAATSSMATTASTMGERCDGHERQNAGQNQTDK